jgi:hypothetical protein
MAFLVGVTRDDLFPATLTAAPPSARVPSAAMPHA